MSPSNSFPFASNCLGFFQQIKSNKIHALASKFWRCACRESIDSAEIQNENNLTLETKIADEKNQTTGTTTIECINDTRFQSIRKVRQLKDPLTPPQVSKRDMSQQLDAIIDSMAHQANELKELLSAEFVSKRKDKTGENVAQQFFQQHQQFLSDAVVKLRAIANEGGVVVGNGVPLASTPYRSSRNATIGQTVESSPLRASSKWGLCFYLERLEIIHFAIFPVRGAAINKSFLENHRSDLSIGDVSTWLHLRSEIVDTSFAPLKSLSIAPKTNPPDNNDTDMQQFKELLAKIREVMEGLIAIRWKVRVDQPLIIAHSNCTFSDSYSDNTELSSATRKLEHALDDIIASEERKRTYL